MSDFDIVSLIEQNPITKLSGDYHNKLITKIKATFNDSQQQMFVASFYCYLNCDKKNDFVIDLDNVWKWLGFSSKYNAKRFLEQQFILNTDYKILLLPTEEQKTLNHGGNNKQTILLNIDTFKKFCLKAGTKKADEVHEYYIKLEETLHEVIQEESNELKIQLENYKNEQNILHNKIITNEKDKLLIREKTILQQFPNNTQCVYVYSDTSCTRGCRGRVRPTWPRWNVPRMFLGIDVLCKGLYIGDQEMGGFLRNR